MDDIIKGIISGYLDAFNGYSITDSNLQEEVDSYKNRLSNFASANNDVTVFYQRFVESGLQEEYTNLITKVVMASLNSTNENTVHDETTVMPVKEFVEQYRIGYEEIRKAG